MLLSLRPAFRILTCKLSRTFWGNAGVYKFYEYWAYTDRVAKENIEPDPYFSSPAWLEFEEKRNNEAQKENA